MLKKRYCSISHTSGELVYFVQGKSQRSVLFFHGDGQNHSAGEHILKLFPDSYKKISVDFPGHGYSTDYGHRTLFNEVDLLLQIIQKEKVESSIIIGHSHGAAAALLLATKHLIQSLVLFDPFFVNPLMLFQREAIEDLQRKYLDAAKGKFYPNKPYHIYGTENPDKEIQEKSFLNTPLSALERNLYIYQGYDVREKIVSLNKPILVFQSDMLSPTSTKEHVLRIKKSTPRMRVEVIEGSTHNMHLLCKEKVLLKIKDYFGFLCV